MFFPLVIGGAVAVDAFAAGVWLGHRWGASSQTATIKGAVAEALKHAVTLPSGGLPEVVHEVATGATQVAADVKNVADAIAPAAQSATQAAAGVHATLDALLATKK